VTAQRCESAFALVAAVELDEALHLVGLRTDHVAIHIRILPEGDE